MFVLTYGRLKSQAFGGAIEHLTSIKSLPNLQSYNVAKIYKHLTEEEEIASSLYDKLVDDYVEKVDGVGVQDPPGSGRFKLRPKTLPEFNEKIREFNKHEVTIDRPKLELRHFIKELTPKDIAALEPLWADVDEGALKG